MQTDFLDAAEQAALAQLACQAIRLAVERREDLPAKAIEDAMRDRRRLAERRGVFVTLHVGGELRGCLGEITPADPLARTTARCAAHAAYADYRFPPISRAELPDVTFKISVLTPPEPLPSPAEIVIGRDGLILRHAHRTGLLLPEVPVEYGWDRQTFLDHLWRKAGVDPAVGLDAVRLERFQTQVFRGEDFLEKDAFLLPADRTD
jgi:AmmeMemoRadiSam system protein A